VFSKTAWQFSRRSRKFESEKLSEVEGSLGSGPKMGQSQDRARIEPGSKTGS
jgi:hypothetical protein